MPRFGHTGSSSSTSCGCGGGCGKTGSSNDAFPEPHAADGINNLQNRLGEKHEPDFSALANAIYAELRTKYGKQYEDQRL